MISDKTDSSSDKNTKKAKNKVLGHLLSLFFGILLGGDEPTEKRECGTESVDRSNKRNDFL